MSKRFFFGVLRTLIVLSVFVGIGAAAGAIVSVGDSTFIPDGCWIRDDNLVIVDYGTGGPNYGPRIAGHKFIPMRSVVIPLWLGGLILLALVLALIIGEGIIRKAFRAFRSKSYSVLKSNSDLESDVSV